MYSLKFIKYVLKDQKLTLQQYNVNKLRVKNFDLNAQRLVNPKEPNAYVLQLNEDIIYPFANRVAYLEASP